MKDPLPSQSFFGATTVWFVRSGFAPPQVTQVCQGGAFVSSEFEGTIGQSVNMKDQSQIRLLGSVNNFTEFISITSLHITVLVSAGQESCWGGRGWGWGAEGILMRYPSQPFRRSHTQDVVGVPGSIEVVIGAGAEVVEVLGAWLGSSCSSLTPAGAPSWIGVYVSTEYYHEWWIGANGLGYTILSSQFLCKSCIVNSL